MRLSEAIRLGSMATKQAFGRELRQDKDKAVTAACARAAALMAAGTVTSDGKILGAYTTLGSAVQRDAQGRPDVRYCIHSTIWETPDEDEMLGQMLLLQGDEQTFLRTANATRLQVN